MKAVSNGKISKPKVSEMCYRVFFTAISVLTVISNKAKTIPIKHEQNSSLRVICKSINFTFAP